MVKKVVFSSKKSVIRLLLVPLCIILNCNITLAAEKRILIDSIHAHNFLDKKLTPDNYNYHEIHGSSLAFQYLDSMKYSVDEIKEGYLTKEKLSDYGMLFINLVSVNLAPLTVKEIAAIKDFIFHGGSLFIITDHSDCYHHMHMLTPLLLELDITPLKESACDVWPNTIGTGNAWIIINNFKPHPITKNLKNVVFQTGGIVDSRYAIATTSKEGWGDIGSTYLYDQGDESRGLYGNWEKEPGEKTGEIGTILAKELGEGKIVIVGDQNIFGNLWIKYADNYKLFLNIISWMFNDEEIKNYSKFASFKKPNILLFENYSKASFGNPYKKGLYNTLANINRYFWTFVHNEIEHDYDLLVFPNQDYRLQENQIKLVKKHLQDKKNILILTKNKDTSKTNQNLLNTIIKTGFNIKNINSYKNIIEYNLSNAGKIVLLLNIGKLENENINKPFREPTLKQKQKAYFTKDLISNYIFLLNSLKDPVSLGPLQIKSKGFLNYFISDGDIRNNNLYIDNDFRFFQDENALRYRNFYKFHAIEIDGNKDFPLIINANYPLKIVRTIRTNKNHPSKVKLELDLTLISPEGGKIKTYQFNTNISLPNKNQLFYTLQLPKQLGKYTIDYLWKLRWEDSKSKEFMKIYHETQHIYLLLKEPIEESRLYLSLIDKSISWIKDLKPHTEEKILDALFNGIWSLGEKGYYYQYGGYALPKNSNHQDKLDIFIDHKAINCGELRCLMLNLAGYYGIEGKQFLIIGKKENWYDGNYVVYKTKKTRAFGPTDNIREWIHFNHAGAIFNNKFYDPTFNIKANSFQEYTDELFTAFGKPIKNTPCNSEYPWCYKNTDLVEFISKDKIDFPLELEISSDSKAYR
ncbi:MAG: hypothetical protein P9M06_07695 [Candidatus Saelkia tenebricola]|nr:hypothetical protein [Candidatus Saelkia tenebricola]